MNSLETKATKKYIDAQVTPVRDDLTSLQAQVSNMQAGSSADSSFVTGYAASALKQFQSEHYYSGSIMSIIDDDGYHNFIDAGIADLYRELGVRCSLAIVACRAETTTGTTTSGDPYVAMSWDELAELASQGFEILNHSYSHDKNIFPSNVTVTEDQIKAQYEQSQSLFLKNGFNPRTIVYPWGNPKTNVSELARKYFEYGVLYGGSTTGFINFSNTFNYIRIPRNASSSVSEIKSCIDQCASNNSWFLLGTHSYGTGPSPSLKGVREILEYAISKNIRIEPFERAMRLRKPAFSCGTTDSNCITIYGNGTFSDTFVKALINKAKTLGLLSDVHVVTITGITVTYTGTSQIIGEAVDLSSVSVTKNMSDSTSSIVTSGYVLQTGDEYVVEGTHNYTIIYTENGTSYSGTFTMLGVAAVSPEEYVDATDFALVCDNEQVRIPNSESSKRFAITYTPENANRNLDIAWTSYPEGIIVASQSGKFVDLRATTDFVTGQKLIGTLVSDTSVVHEYDMIQPVNQVTSIQIHNTSSVESTAKVLGYFNTGYIPNQNTKIEFEASINQGAAFGARTTSNTNAFFMYRNTTSQMSGAFGTQALDDSVTWDKDMHVHTMDKTGIYRDGVLLYAFTDNEPDFTSGLELLIGNVNDAAGVTLSRNANYMSIKSFKIYENDVLVHDYIPIVENEMPYLYDQVTNTNCTKVGDGYLTYIV